MIMSVIIIMSSLILLQTWSLVDKITIITTQMNQCVLPNECLVPVLSGRAHLNMASFDNGIAQDLITSLSLWILFWSFCR